MMPLWQSVLIVVSAVPTYLVIKEIAKTFIVGVKFRNVIGWDARIEQIEVGTRGQEEDA